MLPLVCPGNESVLFRSVYTSPAGWTVLAADFKHVECRVWANVAADGQLLEALSAPDLFRQLARLWYVEFKYLTEYYKKKLNDFSNYQVEET